MTNLEIILIVILVILVIVALVWLLVPYKDYDFWNWKKW